MPRLHRKFEAVRSSAPQGADAASPGPDHPPQHAAISPRSIATVTRRPSARTSPDTLVLLLLPLAATVAALFVPTNYLVGIFLFYGLPPAYLIMRRSALFNWRVPVSAFAIATPFAIIVDYIGVANGIWFVPHSILSARSLGMVPLEDLVWLATAVFTISILYYRFSTLQPPRHLSPRFWGYVAVGFLAVAVFTFSARLRPSLYVYHSPYTYLMVAALFFLTPALLLVLRHPASLRSAAPVMLYFLYLTVPFELLATHLNYWTFPGSYALAPIRFSTFGAVPLEEFVFVCIVGPHAALAVLVWLYPVRTSRLSRAHPR